MLSLRSFARTAPRSLSRFTTQTSRPSLSAFRNPGRIPKSFMPITRATVTPFSTSVRRLQDEGNQELVAKLDSEIGLEEDMKESNEEREFKEFFKGTWDILEKPGSQEVTLTRKYNDETIEISFSTTDAAQMEQPGAESEVDEVYEDEEFGQPEASPQSRGANTKGSVNAGKTQDANIRVAPEDRVAPADRPEPTGEEGDYGDEEGDRGSSFPVRLLIKITRDGKPGAMEIDAEASGGYLDVHNAAYWPSTDLTARTAEAELKRAMLYGGPSFHTLDDDLQSLMMAFLEERGIDVEMCLRLPDVVDWKEQREYNKWLHDIKDFLS